MTPAWRRYARFWGVRVEADVDDELEFHIAMLARDYHDHGMGEREARAAALERLGDVPGARGACLTIGYRRQRRMTRVQMIDAFLQDCRYALRMFGRQKAWTAVALLTLALGIGASTAMFSVVNSLILHPLSYVGADRVVMVWLTAPNGRVSVSPSKDIADVWQKSARSFDAMEPYGAHPVTLTGRGEPVSIESGEINSSFLNLAGVRPIIGRAFLSDEQRRGGAPVALLSEGLWRTRFGGSDSALQGHITLDGTSFAIVGVVPSSLRLPALYRDHIDVWTPIAADTAAEAYGMPIARLRPGVSIEDATRELDALTARSGINAGPSGYHAKLTKPAELVSFKESLYLLSGAVALFLLVACANVAHLLLARGAARERELAIRASLGASRLRLSRQLLTESLLLAGFGCLGGIAVAYLGVRALLALRPASLNALSLTQLDSRALAVAISMSVLTGLAFGLTAALHAVRRTSSESLRTTSLTGTADRGSHKLRSFLVVTEMAVSAMLLVGAALLVRSVRNLQHVDVHFDPSGLYALKVEMPSTRYPTKAARAAFMKQIAERLRTLPAVEKAALAQSTPPNAGMMLNDLETDDGTRLHARTFMAFNSVSPEYFAVIGLRLIQGRTLSTEAVATNEIIVNEGIARKLWPDGNAVGKRVRMAGSQARDAEPWKTVVGVAANIPAHSLSDDPAAPMFYLPIEESAGYVSQPATFAVRSRPGIDPTSSLRRVVMSLDSQATPPSVESVSAALNNSIARQGFTMKLLTVFAGLAVVLSAIGLYGVISYVVTQRTGEIGIRIALGAMPAQVARTIAARGLILSTVGLAVGLTAAIWGTKLIKSALFGVTGTDAVSYIGTGAALLAVSIIAAIVPMRRAMRVDPVIAMRGD